MRFGIVTGNVVSTIKHEKLHGIKLAIVQPLDPDGNVIGNEEIVADYLNANVGNLIFWTADGQAISNVMGIENVPLRGSIIGIIDKIDMELEKKVIKGYS
ncbi:MAG: EutN/CcmL family microcompartment protein [Actinobacteria bacterium]|nr:EutN/CcmL family microcompartment protein [Actinomycetota bacterium]